MTPESTRATTAPDLTAAHAVIYREAIAQVCEGWTLLPGVRKVLETALWAEPEQPSPSTGGEPARPDFSKFATYDDWSRAMTNWTIAAWDFKMGIAGGEPATDSTGRDVCAEMRALCSACGGTGDVVGLDGEWRGKCDCEASAWSRVLAPVARELDADAERRKNYAREVPEAIVRQIIEFYKIGVDAGRPYVMDDTHTGRSDFAKAYEIGFYDDAARATAESAPASAAPDATQDQSNVMPPFAAPAGQHGAWVSTSERLPKKYEEVIVWPHPTDYCMTAELFGMSASGNPVWKYGEYITGFGHEVVEMTQPVTHWMPKPTTPEQSNIAGSARQGGEQTPSKVSSPVGAKESK